MSDPTPTILFFAGLVSFLSPCVLPLVPGYLSYMSGFGPDDHEAPKRVSRTFVMSCFFVLGFSLVFVALGATATLLGDTLRDNKELIARVGGVLIILLGLVFMGVLRVPWLYREARFHPSPRAGAWGSLLMGGTFAFGWSPCIGPTTAIALTMAAGRSDAGGPLEGAALLGIYSLGLGVPFILAALGVGKLTGALAWMRRRIRVVNLASGILLVGVGVLFLTNRLFELSIWFQRRFTEWGLDFWSEF